MIFNNYQIPKEITKEEEFTYNLKEKLYWTNSASGFVLGGLSGLIEKMKEMGVTSELIEEANKVYDSVNAHLGEYHREIFQLVLERWKELGKPLSLEAHQRKKEALDKEDQYRADYYDR